jgi:hypothetical protein
MRQFTGPEIIRLKDIVLNHYDNFSFAMFFSARLNKQFFAYVAPAAPFEFQVYTVIKTANFESWHGTLLNALIAEKPGNKLLVGLAIDISLVSVTNDLGDQELSLSGLESMIDGDPMINPEMFIRQLETVKRCVCRIQVTTPENKMEFGTGFLVGTDLVLTNYHVVEKVINTNDFAPRVICKFDFEISGNGNQISTSTDIDLNTQEPVLFHRPNSNLDVEGSDNINAPWGEFNLDYALLRLSKKFGEEPFGPNAANAINQVKRGWIDIPTDYSGLVSGGHMIILQHPDRLPLKMALGFSKITEISDDMLRVRYRINTAPGSSGSPCFDKNFRWIALHNMGDPNYNSRYNQGIPAETIMSDLKKQGITIN